MRPWCLQQTALYRRCLLVNGRWVVRNEKLVASTRLVCSASTVSPMAPEWRLRLPCNEQACTRPALGTNGVPTQIKSSSISNSCSRMSNRIGAGPGLVVWFQLIAESWCYKAKSVIAAFKLRQEPMWGKRGWRMSESPEVRNCSKAVGESPPLSPGGEGAELKLRNQSHTKFHQIDQESKPLDQDKYQDNYIPTAVPRCQSMI